MTAIARRASWVAHIALIIMLITHARLKKKYGEVE